MAEIEPEPLAIRRALLKNSRHSDGSAELRQKETGWIDALVREERLPRGYRDAVLGYVAPMAGRVESLRRDLARPVIVGISGAQGSGKSTFARFLDGWLRKESQLETARLSIDDIYRTRAQRDHLARTVHPLLSTRGVPGTHDVELGMRVLDALTGVGGARTVPLPAFDKAVDDRLPEDDWPRVETPVDVVLFEGWCIGARAQQEEDLAEPVNELEAAEDADGRWRAYVNDRLRAEYAGLFGRLDLLVMLRVPSFDKVLEWRGLQEEKLRARSRGGRGQTTAELARFVQHYERLTRHMLRTMPACADTVIEIGDRHEMSRMVHRSE